jgi:hypothetical protein
MVISVVGLCLSFIGSILVAFSFKKGDVMAWKDSRDKPNYMIEFKQTLFRWGIVCIAVGFLLQIWGLSRTS